LLTGTPREVWCQWLEPHFRNPDGDNEHTACYFTGTYSDEYGFANGMTHPRNVHKDVRGWLKEMGMDATQYIVASEPHQFRDILHCHGIVKGAFTREQLVWMQKWWATTRGHARMLPVLDGCLSYVTKYALKADTDCFDWRLQ